MSERKRNWWTRKRIKIEKERRANRIQYRGRDGTEGEYERVRERKSDKETTKKSERVRGREEVSQKAENYE